MEQNYAIHVHPCLLSSYIVADYKTAQKLSDQTKIKMPNYDVKNLLQTAFKLKAKI